MMAAQQAQRTALVTGSHGVIGRYVARTLAREGWRVVGIGHGEWTAAEWQSWGLAQWVEADVSLPALRSLAVKPELVVHCAGSGAVGLSLSDPHLDFQRTVGTTAAMLEYLRVDAPGAALVYPSSAAVYGVADRMPMPEDLPMRPASPYGMHKRMAEELVFEHARFFGLRCAVVRLFSIYGEGFRKQLLWDACRRIEANEGEFFGTGDETRDWLHVGDAARLLVEAARHAGTACAVVNGGSGESVTVRDVVTELFRLMGRSDRPVFRGTPRPGDPLHYHADMRRALAWDWRPTIGWRDGLARYVAWFREQKG
jgi:UDP-glucose 4-epimerase